MYRLVFEDDSFIDIPGLKTVKIGLAGYTGSGEPRYLYLWIKLRYSDKCSFKKWETLMYYKTLKYINIFNEDNELIDTLMAPRPFLNLYYEEGDMIVQYGNPIYANDAY